MRGVEFRGKNKNTKQWVQGDLIKKDGKYYIGYWVKDDDSLSGNGYVECDIDLKTIGQLTSISNDTHIYLT